LRSEKYNETFVNYQHYRYFLHTGIRPSTALGPYEKLVGFDYSTILVEWAKQKYPNQSLVILTNINVQAKSLEFWAKIPANSIGFFQKDVAILRCKDQTEMNTLIDNIPEEFADAIGIGYYGKDEYFVSNGE